MAHVVGREDDVRGVNALLVLVLVWAVMVVPTALRSRERSPRATVGGFERAMNVLRGDGGAVVDADGMPILLDDPRRPVVRSRLDRSTQRLMARRRTRFTRLVVASLGSIALGAFLGGLAWTVTATVVATTATYTALLRRAKVQRVQARRSVAALVSAFDDAPSARRASPGQTAPASASASAGGGWEQGVTVRLRHWDG